MLKNSIGLITSSLQSSVVGMSEVSHSPPTHSTPALLSTSESYFNDRKVGLLKQNISHMRIVEIPSFHPSSTQV